MILTKKQFTVLFLQNCRKNHRLMETALKSLAHNTGNREALASLSLASHTLEGDALLAQQSEIAQLAARINYEAVKALHHKNLSRSQLSRLEKAIASLKASLKRYGGIL